MYSSNMFRAIKPNSNKKFNKVVHRWIKLSTLCENQQVISRPRRSLLYVPGSSEKMLEKITLLKADCAVMDCEDGVALTKKAEARNNIRRMLDELDFGRSERSVRVNSFESDFIEDDLKTIFAAQKKPESIVFPKVDRAEHIDLIHDYLYRYNGSNSLSMICVIALIESAKAFLNLPEICQRAEEKLSRTPYPLAGLIFGSDDFCATIGATRTKSAHEVLFARQYLIMVAKAFKLQAIDMVYIDFKDLEGLKFHCKEGAEMGYTGKQIIHPGQIPVVEETFRPSKEKIEWATNLIKAFDDHQKSGKGAFTFDGNMIDMPTVLQARNILQLAELISRK